MYVPTPDDQVDHTKCRRLEAVIVSDGYGDILQETLPYMVSNVDDLVIVSSEDDKETQTLCKRMGVKCVLGWNHKVSTKFDKAKAINLGLSHLACNEWLAVFDADVVFPDYFRKWFHQYPVEKDEIYGFDRFDVNEEEWDKVRVHEWMHIPRQWGYLINPPPAGKFASRVGHGGYGGWIPLGFAQIWHSSKYIRYPEKREGTAEHCDLLHAIQWPPQNRVLVGDMYAIHLSTKTALNEDWKGRTSRKWRAKK